jgi:hypothetical protein
MKLATMGRKKTLAGTPLTEIKSASQRFRWARENYGEKGISRERLAVFSGVEDLTGKLVESIERGLASTELMEGVAPYFAQALNFRNPFDARWFFDVQDLRNPFYAPNNSTYDNPIPLAEVLFYEASPEGTVSVSLANPKFIPAVAGIVGDAPVGIRADEANAPRVKSGQIIFLQKKPAYFDGFLIGAEHPTKTMLNELGQKVPVVVIGQKLHIDGKSYLVPINPKFPRIPLDGLAVIGLAVALRTVHAEGWHTDEVAPGGLPVKVV